MALHRFAFRAMAAGNEIQVHGADAREARRAAGKAIDEVLRIEAKFSRYRDDSVVSRINAAAGRGAVPIDEETHGLLAFADTCFRSSGGLFDATSGVLRRAWDFKVSRVPADEELNSVLALIGWEKVEIGEDTIRLPLAGMELDFGGFGKEYAVDRAVAVMRDISEASAMVNLAGDLAITGSLPADEPWRVGVQHPRRADALIATLPVHSGALATSGDYERFMEVKGERHCHVLDPRTGRSARGFRSVTVLASSCLVAGAASTIAMLKGRDEGLAWLASLDLPHLCVVEDGTVVDRTTGLEARPC